MRTIPGLFVGRRALIRAAPTAAAEEPGHQCGSCGHVMILPMDRPAPREFVVRCDCGAFNQL
jgi:hypothetical protein